VSKREQDWIHRNAGLVAQFEAMDKGKTLSIDFTTILGQLEDTQTWVVQVDGQQTDYGEYWWDVTRYLTVSGTEEHPLVDDATTEQIGSLTCPNCGHCWNAHGAWIADKRLECEEVLN